MAAVRCESECQGLGYQVFWTCKRAWISWNPLRSVLSLFQPFLVSLQAPPLLHFGLCCLPASVPLFWTVYFSAIFLDYRGQDFSFFVYLDHCYCCFQATYLCQISLELFFISSPVSPLWSFPFLDYFFCLPALSCCCMLDEKKKRIK